MPAALPIGAAETLVQLRLDGPNKAITRLEVMGFKITAELEYQDCQCLLLPTPEFAEDLGKPVQQIVDKRKAEGDCEAE